MPRYQNQWICESSSTEWSSLLPTPSPESSAAKLSATSDKSPAASRQIYAPLSFSTGSNQCDPSWMPCGRFLPVKSLHEGAVPPYWGHAEVCRSLVRAICHISRLVSDLCEPNHRLWMLYHCRPWEDLQKVCLQLLLRSIGRFGGGCWNEEPGGAWYQPITGCYPIPPQWNIQCMAFLSLLPSPTKLNGL